MDTSNAPDPRPGYYYVSCVDGPRRALVAGPYVDHDTALAEVDVVKAEAERVDPRAIWYAWGTARSETNLGPGAAAGTAERRTSAADTLPTQPMPRETLAECAAVWRARFAALRMGRRTDSLAASVDTSSTATLEE